MINMGEKDTPIGTGTRDCWIISLAAGRTLEIFLDYMTSFALSCEDYMFDDAYDALLTPEELLFVNEMKKFMRHSVSCSFLSLYSYGRRIKRRAAIRSSRR